MKKGRKVKKPDEKLVRMVARIEQRIRQKGLTVAEACQRAGLGATYIRDMKTRNYSPSIDKLERLVKVLDWSVAQLMEEEGAQQHRLPGLPVLYAAQVGQYRDVALDDPNEVKRRIGIGTDGRFPGVTQYAVHIVDDSMDQEGLPRGSYATCVDLRESGLTVRAGMLVHVEKTAPGTTLVESSLKKVIKDKNTLKLVANGSGRQLVAISADDEGVDIRGVVLGQFIPLPI